MSPPWFLVRNMELQAVADPQHQNPQVNRIPRWPTHTSTCKEHESKEHLQQPELRAKDEKVKGEDGCGDAVKMRGI